MFKKFTRDQLSSSNRAKSSAMKKLKRQMIAKYPVMELLLDTIFPKKGVMYLATVKLNSARLTIIMDEEYIPWFFQIRNSDPIPTLKTLHRFPDLLPRFQVDSGAIRFVLKGADIFCRGLTSDGGQMCSVESETVVAIYAEGKQHACGIGVTNISSEEIKEINDGIGVYSYHFLGDGLWIVKDLAP